MIYIILSCATKLTIASIRKKEPERSQHIHCKKHLTHTQIQILDKDQNFIKFKVLQNFKKKKTCPNSIFDKKLKSYLNSKSKPYPVSNS